MTISRLMLPLMLPLMLAAVCSAQEATTVNPIRQARKPQPPIVTMSFGGGTMADFVAAVQRAQPKCNIVVAKAAASASLPSMELKQAGLDQVLESACAVASSDGRIACSQSRGNGEPVFAIIARPVAQPGQTVGSQDKIGTIVLSLNRLTDGDARSGLKGLKVPTILSAIEAGNYFEDRAPKMRYHEDSGLLFMRGSNRQLQMAAEVLNILERDQKERARSLPIKRVMTGPGAPDKSDK